MCRKLLSKKRLFDNSFMTDTRKLSKLQKVILRRLFAYIPQCRAEGLRDSGPGLPRGVLFVPMS
jgi:hypothetical protein